MSHTAFRPGFRSTLLITGLLLVLPGGIAAQRSAAPAAGHQPAAEQAQTAVAPYVSDDANAEQTRQKLNELLEKYPPSLGRVLKLDPTLMTNQAYLAPYPALASFLAQHPDVAHNPAYFLDRVNIGIGRYDVILEPRLQQRQEFYNLIGNFTAFLVFLVVTGVLIWLIRLFTDQRRWNRLSKVQTEVHTKLLDRFSSNEDLLAYIQTPAGRRFLESAPIPLHDESRPLGAPFARILWSVQAGIVLAIGGLGVLFVSTRFADEPAQFFFVVGMVTLALGGGFIVSAVAAYALSRRLGLLEKPVSDHA
jgi:hypothetical protein